MSIRMPEANWSRAGINSTALEFPTNATGKDAAIGFVFGFWMRTLPQGSENNTPHTIFSRGTGSGTGGDDSYIALNNSFTDVRFQIKKSGLAIVPETSVAVPALNEPFLVLIAANATNLHLITCALGGTPNVTTTANSFIYDRDNPAVETSGLGGPVFERIGAESSATPFFGEVENVFCALGEFPETAGVPDSTLIQNIADGTQDISTLAGQLTNGTLRCHFSMLRRNDYADATGTFGDLTVKSAVPENAETGEFYYSGGYLRPGAIRPENVGHRISPLSFADPETTAGATTTIRAEGGTYHGITPSDIEARLVKEDGTAHVDWTVIDNAPSGGAWTGADFTGVDATPGYLDLQFRAVDGTGTPITEPVPSKGLRGTGFIDDAAVGQSQFMFLLNNSAADKTFDVGVRFVSVQAVSGIVEERMQSSTIGQGRGTESGLSWFANEIQARFPGYPIQMGIIGQSGNGLEQWQAGGSWFGRWAALAGYYGIEHPSPTLLLFGHSDSPATRADYLQAMRDARSNFEAEMGTLSRIGVFPTPRYSGIADSSTYTKLRDIRAACQDFVDENPGIASHYGSGAVVHTDTSFAVSTQPHPEPSPFGMGRSGSLLGLGLMARHGAIQGPAKLGSLQVVSDTEIRIPLVDANT